MQKVPASGVYPADKPSINHYFFPLQPTMADEDFETGDLFQDPEGFYPEEAPATFAEHSMLSGQKVRVRLVGSHPLYGMTTTRHHRHQPKTHLTSHS